MFPNVSRANLLDSIGKGSDEWTHNRSSNAVEESQEVDLEVMYIFTIDAEDRVAAHAATKPLSVPKDAHRFSNLKELTRLIAGWPGTRLVEIWNKLPNTRKVLRFTDRKTAIQRIWEVVQNLQPMRPRECARNGTKGGRIIDLLTQPSGATLTELMTETGWQAHSVRGFISGQLSRRLGFRVKSFKHDGERVYRIERKIS